MLSHCLIEVGKSSITVLKEVLKPLFETLYEVKISFTHCGHLGIHDRFRCVKRFVPTNIRQGSAAAAAAAAQRNRLIFQAMIDR